MAYGQYKQLHAHPLSIVINRREYNDFYLLFDPDDDWSWTLHWSENIQIILSIVLIATQQILFLIIFLTIHQSMPYSTPKNN